MPMRSQPPPPAPGALQREPRFLKIDTEKLFAQGRRGRAPPPPPPPRLPVQIDDHSQDVSPVDAMSSRAGLRPPPPGPALPPRPPREQGHGHVAASVDSLARGKTDDAAGWTDFAVGGGLAETNETCTVRAGAGVTNGHDVARPQHVATPQACARACESTPRCCLAEFDSTNGPPSPKKTTTRVLVYPARTINAYNIHPGSLYRCSKSD